MKIQSLLFLLNFSALAAAGQTFSVSPNAIINDYASAEYTMVASGIPQSTTDQ